MKNLINFLGMTSVILSIGIVLCFLCFIGHNTYVSITKEKIEAQAMNSNY